MTAGGDSVYHPKDAIGSTLKTTSIMGGAGLFASAVQNTLQKRNFGPFGVLTRTGGTIAIFASMGGAYQFTKDASANLREKDDYWNSVIGGFFSGAVLGLRARAFPPVFGYGFVVASTLGIFDYTGGSFRGFGKQHITDDFEEREKLRTSYRSPAEETFSQLGEGRGIYAPGYPERRAERIKQKYGIDVPTSQPSAQ